LRDYTDGAAPAIQARRGKGSRVSTNGCETGASRSMRAGEGEVVGPGRWRGWADRLPGGRLVRRLAVLAGATVLGQGLLVATAPLLTRLFSPVDFGLLAIFAALVGLLGVVAGLRYEFAIPMCRDEDEAAGMVVLCLVLSCLLAIACALIVLAAGPGIATALGIAALAPLLWLLPPCVLVLGLGQAFDYWSIRQGSFRVNAVSRLVLYGGQAGTQVGLGLAGASGAGLALGYAFGYLARLIYFAAALPAAERARLRSAAGRRLWPLARMHWRYPAFSSPAALLQSAVHLLPAIPLAALYGPAVAGWFALVQRLINLPVRMLGQAASQVYLGEVAERPPAAVYRLFLRTSIRFLALGLVGMLPLLLAGPALFAFVFGEPWRPAGEFAQALVPFYLARFVVAPVSQTLNRFERLDLHLLSTGIGAAALALTFAASWRYALSPFATVLTLGISGGMAQLLTFVLAWQVARRHAGQAALQE
jgi:O-antigen/teichoic acid export membrane protein